MIKHDGELFNTINGNRVTIPYDPKTNLPILNAYKSIVDKSVLLKGMAGSITDENIFLVC